MPRSPLGVRYSHRGFHPAGIWPTHHQRNVTAATVTAPEDSADNNSISTAHSASPASPSSPINIAEGRLKAVQESFLLLKKDFASALSWLKSRHRFYRLALLTDNAHGIRELRKVLKEAHEYLAGYLELAVEARAGEAEGLVDILHGRWRYISSEITWRLKPVWGVGGEPVSYVGQAVDVRRCLGEIQMDLARAKEGVAGRENV
ncbi:hypothetical protein MMC30_007021 [Trapelia coarctata]|nr:hypothetical protein [Trapelia coarctata]